MREVDIQQLIRIKASELGVVLSRNNCGRLQDRNGRWVSFGLFSPGGSDLIGLLPITITQDMVGKVFAKFIAIEVKTPTGKIRPEQAQFINFINKNGGLAGIVRSVEDFKKLVVDYVH